jgi:hypothetical protein
VAAAAARVGRRRRWEMGKIFRALARNVYRLW